jgi:hypothetical protein
MLVCYFLIRTVGLDWDGRRLPAGAAQRCFFVEAPQKLESAYLSRDQGDLKRGLGQFKLGGHFP